MHTTRQVTYNTSYDVNVRCGMLRVCICTTVVFLHRFPAHIISTLSHNSIRVRADGPPCYFLSFLVLVVFSSVFLFFLSFFLSLSLLTICLVCWLIYSGNRHYTPHTTTLVNPLCAKRFHRHCTIRCGYPDLRACRNNLKPKQAL